MANLGGSAEAPRPLGRDMKPKAYVPRFAGEAFAHSNDPEDGPMLRKLASTVAWKVPPSSKIRSELST